MLRTTLAAAFTLALARGAKPVQVEMWTVDAWQECELWSANDGPAIFAREGIWDIATYSHHSFGERARKPATYPWDCNDTPVPGASPEASCIWDALFACVANATAGDGGRSQLYFQACMEKGWFFSLGPQYVPYDWLNTNSAEGHAPYEPSALALGCLAATTAVSEAALRTCVGLDGSKDAFIGSPGHALVMADFEYSESTFAAAGVEEAGPSIFVNGALVSQGSCAQPSGYGDITLNQTCVFRLLDSICAAYDGEKPAGCAH